MYERYSSHFLIIWFHSLFVLSEYFFFNLAIYIVYILYFPVVEVFIQIVLKGKLNL